MTLPEPIREPQDELIEELVFRCLEATDPAAELAAATEDTPEIAATARALLDRLRGQGLLESDQELPSRLGHYELGPRLGEGGMGIVFAARDRRDDAPVAVKIVRPDMLGFQNARVRFENEIRAIERLEHPGIVRILDAGEEQGVRYFAMERVEGESLSDLLRRLADRELPSLEGRDLFPGPLLRVDTTTSERSLLLSSSWIEGGVRIAAGVARALAHAHENGVLHRDVKPGNVILGADGRPRLLDFGLARAADAATVTHSGAAVGSLAYMSPEQLRGDRDRIDQRTDVYGVGVLLFELLTLRSPFLHTDDARLTQARILAGKASHLRRLHPAISRDLALVCRQAMAVQPAARYQTASQLAHDLEAVLSGTPVHAGSRSRALVQRHPLVIAGVAGFALVGWASTAVWSYRVVSEGSELRGAVAGMKQTTAEAVHESVRARWSGYRRCLAAAQLELHHGNLDTARNTLRAAPESLRSWEWHHLWRRTRLGGREWQLPNSSAAWMAGAGEHGITLVFNARNKFLLCDPATGKTQLRRRFSGRAVPKSRSTTLSVDGTRFASIDREAPRWGNLLDIARNTLRPYRLDTAGELVFQDSTGDRCAFALEDGTTVVLDAETARVKARLTALRGQHWSAAAFSPDGSLVAAAVRGGGLHVLDVESDTQRAEARLNHTAIQVEFGPDGKELRVLLANGDLEFRRARDAKETVSVSPSWSFRGLDVPPIDGFVSEPNGACLWTRHRDGFVRLFHRPTGQWVFKIPGRRFETGERVQVPTIAIDAHRGHLLTSGHRRRVLDRSLTELKSGWIPYGQRLASHAVNSRGDVFIQPFSGPPVLRRRGGEPETLRNLTAGDKCAFVDDSVVAVAPRRGGDVLLIDIDKGEIVSRLPGHDVPRGVCVLPDGRIATGDRTGTVRIFDRVSRTCVQTLEGHDRDVRCLVPMPDGDRLVTAGYDGTVRLWNLRHETHEILLDTQMKLYDLAVSPNGRWVAAGGVTRGARVYDLHTNQAIGESVGQHDVSGLAFSADSRRLVLTSYRSHQIRIFAVGTWERVITLIDDHGAAINSADFAPDGRTLITSDYGGFVRLWRAGE